MQTVTKLAYKQIRQFGMNERIGLVSFADTDGAEFSGEKPYSKQTAAIIDEVYFSAHVLKHKFLVGL